MLATQNNVLIKSTRCFAIFFCYETDRGAMKPTGITMTKLMIKVCNTRLMGLQQ